MGKVFVKMKHNNILKADIPHSLNFANAVYGFLEMGAEVIPYYNLDNIYDQIEREDIVLDYIDQCREVFAKFNVYPSLPDYPDCLKEYLGRNIYKDTINNISCDESKWSAGYFVKPVKSKVFTGKIIKSINDLIGCGSTEEDLEVLISEPIDIVAEWRCFISYDKIIDVRPYGLLMDTNRKSYYYHYDANVLKRMMESFQKWEQRPLSCAMDICVTKDNRTLLVEFNDAYSLGSYGLSSVFYAKFISARWSQLLNTVDEYHF